MKGGLSGQGRPVLGAVIFHAGTSDRRLEEFLNKRRSIRHIKTVFTFYSGALALSSLPEEETVSTGIKAQHTGACGFSRSVSVGRLTPAVHFYYFFLQRLKCLNGLFQRGVTLDTAIKHPTDHRLWNHFAHL